MEKDKIAFKGSHPDSLYRVGAATGATGKLSRAMRVLRWPAALLVICLALTVFVYFLMPSNMMDVDIVNGTAWDADVAEAAVIGVRPHTKITHPSSDVSNSTKPNSTQTLPPGATTPTGTMKTTEIDFYENEQIMLPDIIANPEELPPKANILSPVFPENITPEVQYGNEKADTDGFRSGIPQVLRDIIVPEDSTMKTRITQKPEKPLTIYFNDAERVPMTTEIVEDTNLPNINFELPTFDKATSTTTEKAIRSTEIKETPRSNISDDIVVNNSEKETETFNMGIVSIGDTESGESNFTSGHSKLFGISVEDAEKMKSTTQNSVYNTRVSPTLPTWHDGDDATTKNYPGMGNLDVPQCSSTRLEMCRGILPYDLTGAPLKMAGVDVSSLLPLLQQLISSNCSARLPQFVCVLLEPECSAPPYPPRMPCYNLCRTIAEQCESQIQPELSPVFNCNLFSSSNCLSARAPCAASELACGDGSCVPQAWACDGARDCPDGEDEDSVCAACSKYEYRCQSGTCIMNQWLCDGFSDCPGGEDEAENICETWEGRGGRLREPEDVLRGVDEEAAESAPSPSIRYPGRLQVARDAGEFDASKELLITSDTNNGLKRNFTRRPPLSRLTPYSPPLFRKLPEKQITDQGTKPKITEENKYQKQRKQPVIKLGPNTNRNYEDVNYADIFDEYKKEMSLQQKTSDKMSKKMDTTPEISQQKSAVRQDTSLDNLGLFVDSAAIMKKATKTPVKDESPEYEDFSTQNKGGNASPCPTGELRCVDGRCITLAQLCDGTVDCSDHADEENCDT